LAVGVGLTLDGLPFLSVLDSSWEPLRHGVMVADDADGEELVEDGPLVPEDSIDGLHRHVGLLSDRGDGRRRIAVAEEERLGCVEHPVAGGESLAGPPSKVGFNRVLHVNTLQR
jgi:hypothetical protein